jgi:CHAT domain-containing protein
MGKKVKPKSLLDGSSLQIIEKTDNNELTRDIEIEVGYVPELNRRLTQDDIEKLEKYPALEQTVIDLTKQNAELQTKIEEYVNKLNAASSDKSTDEQTSVNEELEAIKAELKKAKADLASYVGKTYVFEQDMKALRDENDQYLMKISDLTFEVAMKTSQLNELSKNAQQTGTVVNQKTFQPVNDVQNDTPKQAKPFVNPYNPYINNGYGTW